MTRLVEYATYNKRNITWDPNELFGPHFACDTAVVVERMVNKFLP